MMGALPQGPTLLQDLKVTILSSTTLYPSEKTERRSMFLSNIDQVLNFDVETIHFFATNLEFPTAAVVERLSSALEKVLVPYDFLAGRLKLEPGDGRLVIDCNAAGVELVVASSELKLEEVGDLECPNPAFRQLVTENPDNGLAMEDRSLCSFQVLKQGTYVLPKKQETYMSRMVQVIIFPCEEGLGASEVGSTPTVIMFASPNQACSIMCPAPKGEIFGWMKSTAKLMD